MFDPFPAPLMRTRDRERLRLRLIEALRGLPGAISLHEFGSGSLGMHDDYSDIDFQVTVVNIAKAVAGHREVLSGIAPVMLEWVFLNTSSSWASTILFDGVHPFHHLDLGFSIAGFEERNPIFEGAALLWTQLPRETSPNISAAIFAPDMDSVEHMMIGEILGLLRYTKARRRHHDLLCWKFLSALANRVLEVEYLALVDRERSLGKPLTGHEHKLLREALTVHDAHELAQYLLWPDTDAMDRAVVALGHRLVQTCRHIAALSDASMLYANTLLQWLASELPDKDSADAVR